MFYAPMGRFQLELIYYFTYVSTVAPSNGCVSLYCSPFVVNTTFSTGLVGVEVSSISTPRRHVENVLLTAKGPQEKTHTVEK